MPGYVEMEDASAVVSQNQEHVKHLKSDGRHSQEVYRDHALDVILQEDPPGLRGWNAPAYEVLAHTRFTDVDAQLEQFPMHTRSTPERIVAAHPANQLPNLFGGRGPPGLAPTIFPGPEQPKALAMPANDAFRLDNHQEGSPIAPSLRITRPTGADRLM